MSQSAAQTVWLISSREITTRLRTKSFIISTAVLLLLVFGGVLFSGFSSKTGFTESSTAVATVGQVPTQLEQSWVTVTEVADRATAEDLVTSGAVDAAVIADSAAVTGVTVIADQDAPYDVVQLLSVVPEVVILNPVTENPMLAMMIGIAFGIIWMMSALTFGVQIAQSVVEEKQTRIVEILLATVNPKHLLTGKILGNSILALGTVVAVLVLAALGMTVTGQNILLDDLGPALLWFGILFIFGFVLLASMFAALGSLVSRQEEVSSVTSPLTIIIMIPYILVIMFFNDPQILSIMSYVPFSAPVGMPMRLYLGTAQWWEPLLSLGIILVSIIVIVWIGAKIYAGSVLRTGKRVKLSEALRGQ